MPAPISSTQPGKVNGGHPHTRKTRAIRRRGRAKLGEDSDEEIERIVTTDDESDGDQSSVDSESDSESLSDDHQRNGRSEVVTPSTTQSPPPPDLDSHHAILSKHVSTEVGPFVATTDWADMVTAEHANGSDDLPVIDFADLDHHNIDQHLASAPRSRKPHKKKHEKKRSTSAPPEPSPRRVDDAPIHDPTLSTSTSEQKEPESQLTGTRGQTARQAYQQRLETDPSFVPKVGEFWGHDDRLLEKEYRSLSSWWRGRWQSRGRGRGAFPMRGRNGRREFFGGRFANGSGGVEGESASTNAPEIPPVEKAWTHDGYEELKRRDERHQQQQQEEQQPSAHVRFGPQRGLGFRGRGGFFAARGRGGYNGNASPAGAHPGSPAAASGRPWFAMKPERAWTKQHEAFLYFDFTLKPRPGQGPGFRVKLPGAGPEQIIRGPPRSYLPRTGGFIRSAAVAFDDEEKSFTVCLPRRTGKEKAVEEPAVAPSQAILAEEPLTTAVELSIEEVFTVRPNIVPNRRVDLSLPSSSVSATDADPGQSSDSSLPQTLGRSAVSDAQSLEVNARSRAHSLVMDPEPPIPRRASSSPSAQIKETVLRRPSLSTEVSSTSHSQVPSDEARRPTPPILHPLQTTFSPTPQQSPPYSSSYAYAPALPPGIALNHHGMPYELATGRPVYLHQQTPPPMFTPRPIMHGHASHPSAGMSFVPTHMHHPSNASPDFISHPHPHTPPVGSFIDPATGVPIFTPPRQSSRIEIRAPTESGESKESSIRPSGLRTAMTNSDTYSADKVQTSPDLSAAGGTSGVNVSSSADQPMPHMESAVPYPPYAQQYYYPDPYVYPTYVDVSPQVMHYEMYPTEHAPQPPMIYY